MFMNTSHLVKVEFLAFLRLLLEAKPSQEELVFGHPTRALWDHLFHHDRKASEFIPEFNGTVRLNGADLKLSFDLENEEVFVGGHQIARYPSFIADLRELVKLSNFKHIKVLYGD